MYEKKLRRMFNKAEKQAEAAMEQGDMRTAASYYERCGDILSEQAMQLDGGAQERKQGMADEYYALSDKLVHSAPDRPARTEETKTPDEDTDFSTYVERFIRDSDVTWEDVAGLTETKQALKQSLALSAIENKPPAVESIHSMLLYGPPGTGKSLLASAVAGSNNYTFFHVKLSQALSKYYGESGKIITELFEQARECAPSIVFIDELDAITMQRGGDTDETTRRVMSTLLTELSGFDADNEDILFMAATNTPWDVDDAIISRMERKIHVPLPDAETATEIIKFHTKQAGVDVAVDVQEIAEQCVEERLSGRDIMALCKAAIHAMVEAENPELDALSDRPVEEIRSYDLKTRALERSDFRTAFEKTSAAADQSLLNQYEQWASNH